MFREMAFYSRGKENSQTNCLSDSMSDKRQATVVSDRDVFSLQNDSFYCER